MSADEQFPIPVSSLYADPETASATTREPAICNPTYIPETKATWPTNRRPIIPKPALPEAPGTASTLPPTTGCSRKAECARIQRDSKSAQWATNPRPYCSEVDERNAGETHGDNARRWPQFPASGHGRLHHATQYHVHEHKHTHTHVYEPPTTNRVRHQSREGDEHEYVIAHEPQASSRLAQTYDASKGRRHAIRSHSEPPKSSSESQHLAHDRVRFRQNGRQDGPTLCPYSGGADTIASQQPRGVSWNKPERSIGARSSSVPEEELHSLSKELRRRQATQYGWVHPYVREPTRSRSRRKKPFFVFS